MVENLTPGACQEHGTTGERRGALTETKTKRGGREEKEAGKARRQGGAGCGSTAGDFRSEENGKAKGIVEGLIAWQMNGESRSFKLVRSFVYQCEPSPLQAMQ